MGLCISVYGDEYDATTYTSELQNEHHFPSSSKSDSFSRPQRMGSRGSESMRYNAKAKSAMNETTMAGVKARVIMSLNGDEGLSIKE